MTPSNQHPMRAEEEPNHVAEESAQELPLYAPDAPPLRADDYDPLWSEQAELPPSGAVTQADIERIEQILSSESFRARRRRAQETVPPPPPPAAFSRPGLRWAVGTFAVLVVASAGIAYYATDRSRLPDGTAGDAGAGLARFAALFAPATQSKAPQAAPVIQAQAPAAPARTRLVVDGASADSPDRILLGVAVEGPTDGISAVVSGLAPGSRLTSGRSWGDTGWIVPASELGATYLQPPQGFSGTMEYSVALHRADNRVIDRQTMRLEWAAAEAPPPAESAPPPAAPAAAQARRLAPEEIAHMLRRGEALLTEGDIASARLLLQRAADAQDARAAFVLASSYDPIELRRLGVYGAVPDVGRAREWYEKARLYGSREAPRRLELLASQFR